MKYKNIFVFCTGRSGSYTFTKACNYITNYTAGHETRSSHLGNSRFQYPAYHIESDNRLSWFLGKMENEFNSENTLFIHLIRNKEDTVKSYNRRWDKHNSIIKSFSEGILKIPLAKVKKADRLQICNDYYETVNANIRYFLHEKPHQMTIHFEEIQDAFVKFWTKIDAKGDLNSAINELKTKHNKSKNTYLQDLLYSIKLYLMKLKPW